MTQTEALRLAIRAINSMKNEAETAGAGGDEQMLQEACEIISTKGLEAITAIKAALEAKDEPVAWISVKDELPKAVRGVSYKSSLTDTVLVLHSDRPDYPITAHAVVGEGLGAGVAIPTDGASEHPEIAWYSASCNLNNPFNLKNDDYERFLPKIFGKKITHWMPIPTTPPQRTWVGLTDEEVKHEWSVWRANVPRYAGFAKGIETKLKEKNT